MNNQSVTSNTKLENITQCITNLIWIGSDYCLDKVSIEKQKSLSEKYVQKLVHASHSNRLCVLVNLYLVAF